MSRFRRIVITAPLVLATLAACDSSIAPVQEAAPGAIRADITYVSSWPPRSEIVDIRFVAMRFVPQDTTDFLQLNRLEFSERLSYGVPFQSMTVGDIPPGTYPFAVVARQRTSDILSWEALGIYMENDGVFQVESGDTLAVAITVDFENLPDFP